MEEQFSQNPIPIHHNQTIIIEHRSPKTNGIGLAGFILAIIALFTDFIPVIGWIVWFLGTLFSFIGMFKKPRGFAIAGLIISFIGIIILTVVVGAVSGALFYM